MNPALRRRSLLVLVGVAALAVAMNLVAGPAQAVPAVVTQVTAVETSQDVELSVVASAPIRYDIRDVQPNWIVVDITPAKLAIPAGPVPFAGHKVTKIRVGQFQSAVVRVVVEMAHPTPFRVIPSADGTALLVGIGPGAPRAASAEPAEDVSPQPVIIPFKSTAVIPQGSQTRVTPAPAAQPQAAQPPAPQTQTPPTQRLQSVVPGKALGPVRLGMRVQDVVSVLGQPVQRQALPDGSVLYQWFAPPNNSGLGVRTTPDGLVYRVWVVNDPRYAIQDRVHVGTPEAEVRAVFGAPSQVVENAQGGLKTLTYPSLGLWVVIQKDPRYAYYGQVFEIGVMATEPVAAR